MACRRSSSRRTFHRSMTRQGATPQDPCITYILRWLTLCHGGKEPRLPQRSNERFLAYRLLHPNVAVDHPPQAAVHAGGRCNSEARLCEPGMARDLLALALAGTVSGGVSAQGLNESSMATGDGSTRAQCVQNSRTEAVGRACRRRPARRRTGGRDMATNWQGHGNVYDQGTLMPGVGSHTDPQITGSLVALSVTG